MMRRLLAPVVRTLVLGAVAMVGVAPVHAAVVPAVDAAVPTLQVVSQPFTVLTDVNAKFELAVPANVVINDADHLVLRLHRRVASRDSLISIANRDTTSAVIDVYSLPLYSIQRNTAGHLLPVIPFTTKAKEATALNLPFEGIYPVSISVVRNGITTPLVSVLTYLNRRDVTQPQPQIHAGVVATLVTSPGVPALMVDGSVTVTDAIRQKVRDFVALLQSTSAPLTLMVEPQIVDALNMSSVAGDHVLLNELHTLLRTRTIVTSTYAVTDAAALVGAGLTDLFASQLRLGEATLNRLLPGVTIQRTTWLTGSALDARTIAALRELGITAFVLDSATSATPGTPRGVLARPSGRDNSAVSLVTLDSASVSSVSNNNPVVDGVLDSSYMITERDDLIANGVDPARINLIAGKVDPAYTADPIELQTIATSLESTPGITMTDYGAPLTVDASTTANSFADSLPSTMAERAPALLLAQRELNAVGSMLAEDDPRGDTWSHLLGIGLGSATPAPTTYVSSLRKDLRKVREAITVATPSSIALSSKSGTIRIQLRNTSTSALSVRVRLTSPKLQIAKQPGVVTLLAGGTTDVVVPAESRTNGRVPVVVWVFTPSGGVQIGTPHTITARVTVFAGFGQLVSFTLLLVLLAWWWSHWRRSRREAALATTVSHS